MTLSRRLRRTSLCAGVQQKRSGKIAKIFLEATLLRALLKEERSIPDRLCEVPSYSTTLAGK